MPFPERWFSPNGRGFKTTEILGATAVVKRSVLRLPESQSPTATFALEWFFGFSLGCGASAVRTLHRADLCRRTVRSYCDEMECGLEHDLLQSTSIGIRSGCYSVAEHFRFHHANGEVSPAKSIS